MIRGPTTSFLAHSSARSTSHLSSLSRCSPARPPGPGRRLLSHVAHLPPPTAQHSAAAQLIPACAHWPGLPSQHASGAAARGNSPTATATRRRVHHRATLPRRRTPGQPAQHLTATALVPVAPALLSLLPFLPCHHRARTPLASPEQHPRPAESFAKPLPLGADAPKPPHLPLVSSACPTWRLPQ